MSASNHLRTADLCHKPNLPKQEDHPNLYLFVASNQIQEAFELPSNIDLPTRELDVDAIVTDLDTTPREAHKHRSRCRGTDFLMFCQLAISYAKGILQTLQKVCRLE